MKYRSFPGEDLRPPYVTKQKTSQAGVQLAPCAVFGAKNTVEEIFRKTPIWKTLNPWMPVSMAVRQYSLFLMMVRNNILAKFRHSVLGFFWLFIPPLCILLIYVYMFSVIFKLKWPDADITSRWSFGLVIYTGIILYSGFSETLMGSLSLLLARTGIIKRVPFPLDLLSPSLAAANFLITYAVLVLIYLISQATDGGGSWLALAYLPLTTLPLLLLTTGCSWIISAAGLFFRDLGNLLGIVLLLLFFSAPIFYDAVQIPEGYRWALYLNPLTPVIINTRTIFFKPCAPNWTLVGISWLTGIVAFQLGFCVFMRLRRRFADVV